jgi:hypothetical protein
MSDSTINRLSDDRLAIGVYFTKIDKENRIVSGFATLDNIDTHGDIISAAASKSAFTRFRGGLREMHLPNAVGTVVSFEELNKYDPESKRVYQGIYVDAKVSKGAQDTWEKVLDGTLKGFSIGGKAKRRSVQKNDDGTQVGVIEDYDLIELSLVDNPANPLASVITVQKVGDSFVYPEELVVKQVMSILYHEETGDVILSEDESREGFTTIGWTDSIENVADIQRALDNHHASTEGSAENEEPVLLAKSEQVIIPAEDNTYEGGATVATNETIEKDAGVESDQGVVQSADTDEVTEVETVETTEENNDDETVEKAADVVEVHAVDTTNDDVVEKVTAAVADVLAKATDAMKESKDAVEGVQTSFAKSVEDVNNTISELKSEFAKALEGLAKRVEDVESSSAIKKSADVDTIDDVEETNEETSFWRGTFLSAGDLVK